MFNDFHVAARGSRVRVGRETVVRGAAVSKCGDGIERTEIEARLEAAGRDR
jgi:hypothetical protein